MTKPLDEEYLTWLYSKVASTRERNPGKTYWTLLRQLYSKEFVWLIPNDDNRIMDGLDLRWEFFKDANLSESDNAEWMSLGCSVFELLVALAGRMSFETEAPLDYWFWEMMRNLELDQFSDAHPGSARRVDNILNNLIWRTYDYSGRGGLFPLDKPDGDQRQTEIWYQMSTYLLERS